MQIFINNSPAVLKKGSSFEYIVENRMFTGSDSYSLSITFPIKHCQQNIDLFGHIDRADVEAQKVVFDCEIRDKTFSKFGTITITDYSEIEVKAQFLEGKSEQNFNKSLDNIYINDLDLGEPPTRNIKDISPYEAWNPLNYDFKYIALPWVNDYSGNIQNLAEFKVNESEILQGGHFEWDEENTTGLSWQPYLLHLTKKICEAVNYQYDFSKWEAVDSLKYLLVCNTLPHAWDMPEFAHALPHWSVEEYFQKLELFLGGEFDINHREKTIFFNFSEDILDKKPTILLEKIVDEFSSEINDDANNCKYSDAVNLVYKDCDHQMWKYYSCDWFIKGNVNRIIKYDTLQQIVNKYKQYKQWMGDQGRSYSINDVMYAADCDTYFIVRSYTRKYMIYSGWRVGYLYLCRLQPINMFGGRIMNNDDDASNTEIEFVPACIDDTEDKYGRILFLSFSDFDEDDDSKTDTDSDSDSDSDSESWENSPFIYTHSDRSLILGSKDKKAEYYDRIFIGWYNGTNYFRGTHLPYPDVDDVIIDDDNWDNFAVADFSLRLNSKSRLNKIRYRINPKVSYTFKFLADDIPDVRAPFLIHGKKYICEKITATFSDEGLSQLMKGIFYPVED